MTPERQKWWDSLPAEEKRVRMDIELCKKQIKWHKQNLRWVVLTGDDCKIIINFNKRIIKALRKQIAQYPYRKDTHRVHCPNCWVWIVECYNEPPYCKYCGQKLRWK